MTALAGAVGGLALWFLLVVIYSAARAPSEIAAEDQEEIAKLKQERDAFAALRTPEEVIRLFVAHLDKGVPPAHRLTALRRMTPPPSDAEWAEALYALRDWVFEARSLIDAYCVSRLPEFRPVWKSVPVPLRYSRRDDDKAAAFARRRGADKWYSSGSVVLRGCIGLLEGRLGG
jgi:hypothetical protein